MFKIYNVNMQNIWKIFTFSLSLTYGKAMKIRRFFFGYVLCLKIDRLLFYEGRLQSTPVLYALLHATIQLHSLDLPHNQCWVDLYQ